MEQAFFIMNIPPKDMLKLREIYGQENVITGEIEHREGGKSTTTFKLVDMDGTQAEHIVVLDMNDEASGDFYSEVKGRTFLIPFFDESDNTERTTNEDNEAFEDEGMESSVVNPFTTEEVPRNDKTIPHLATLSINATRIKEDARGERVGMGNYYHRKQIHAALKALKLAGEP